MKLVAVTCGFRVFFLDLALVTCGSVLALDGSCMNNMLDSLGSVG